MSVIHAPRPRIYAHRGYSSCFPENTALAFLEALKAGADGIECDLQHLDDGSFVILHDATLDRTSNGRGPAVSQTLAHLKELDFGQGEKILTLAELLDILPASALLNLELKSDSIKPVHLAELVSILKTAGRTGENTHVSSFRHDLLPPFRRAGYETGMLIGEEHEGARPVDYFKWIFKYRPSCVNIPVQAFERVPLKSLKILFGAFRLLGRKLYFWTVNTPEQFAQVRPFSDAIITDDVPAALEALK